MFSFDEGQYNVDLWTYEAEELIKPSLNWIRNSHLTYLHTEILTYHLKYYQNHMPLYSPNTIHFILHDVYRLESNGIPTYLLIPFWYISILACKSRTKALIVNHVDERIRYHK